jgi:hypothetical protein
VKENVEKTTKNITAFQIIAMDEMGQRAVVPFLRLEGLSTKVIPHELVAGLPKMPSRTRA